LIQPNGLATTAVTLAGHEKPSGQESLYPAKQSFVFTAPTGTTIFVGNLIDNLPMRSSGNYDAITEFPLYGAF
jgi:hypothetical protein